MIDEDVVYASPSSVYRVLRTAGLLNKFTNKKTKSRGIGYEQPSGAHRE